MRQANSLNQYQQSQRVANRAGFTLAELLVASTVMTMILGALGMMAIGVRTSQSISETTGMAQQHARVILNRIRRNITGCTANLEFPGFVVFSEQVGSYTFPDVIAIWKPATSAADPEGLPIWNELVIYATRTDDPNVLLEITLPDNNSTVPALTNLAAWQSVLSNARSGTGAECVELTDLLRSAKPSSSSSERGAIRFDARLRPSASEFNEYVNGTRNWSDLNWVQDIYSSDNGLRQNWCRIEMQLRGSTDSADEAIPFVASAAIHYQVAKP